MLKSVFELSFFTRKTSVKKIIFSKFQKAVISHWEVVRISFLTPVLRHLTVLSSFATLVNIRGKL